MIVLILAGGKGTRLWPLSKDEFPKQFLSFGQQPSLLQKTVSRFLKTSNLKKILISTNDHYSKLVEKQILDIDSDNICEIISEPLPKNTAPAIAYSLKYLEEICKVHSTDKILVTPSDHSIEPESNFHKYLDLCTNQTNSKIIIFGTAASKAETGYGYIEIGEPVNCLTYEIKNFIEKPSLEESKKYIISGKHYWNCGIFLFSIETFWEQLKIHAQNIYAIAKNNFHEVRDRYHLMPNISIDYAMMEKTKELLIAPFITGWSDIGSWDSVYEVLEKDADQNVLIGDISTIDTHNSLIISNGNKIISTIGLDDLLIIDTKDNLLITRKGESQKVKLTVQNITNRNIT
jgi:mannose-1-phosphate guanylyltransferase/mannose-6-phosphate isomerase